MNEPSRLARHSISLLLAWLMALTPQNVLRAADEALQYLPALRVEMPVGTYVRLSWTNSPTPHQLQEADALSESTAWHTVLNRPLTIGEERSVSLPIADGPRFYRLAERSNVAPRFLPIPDQVMSLGETLELMLVATDEDFDPLAYSVVTLPLPSNARLDAATGRFVFRPDATQVGTNSFEFLVSDGTALAVQTVAIVLRAGPPDGVTTLSGRILDTTDAVDGIERPVVGARVSLLGHLEAVLSGADGRFLLTNIPSGLQVLDIDVSTAQPAPGGDPYAGFREQITLVPGVNNIVTRPFYLPRLEIGSLATVNPDAVTVVTNAELAISMSVPPQTAKVGTNNFDGQLSISRVPQALAPAALPPDLEPDLLITIQPVGVTYSQPVPITFPNVGTNLAPGSLTFLWSLDAGTGEFTVVGTGRVSADGQRIETVTGGIRANDWHMFASPASSGKGEQDCGCEPCPKKAVKNKVGSTVAQARGTLSTDFALPAYVSLNQPRSLRFVYQSLRAHPVMAIPFTAKILEVAAVPVLFRYNLLVGGVEQADPVFVNTSGFSEAADTLLPAVAGFDARGHPTGVYPYTVRLSSVYRVENRSPGAAVSAMAKGRGLHANDKDLVVAQAVSSRVSGQLLVVNGQQNPFGAGWDLAGLQRVYVQRDQSILVTSGDGEVQRFQATPKFVVGSRVISGGWSQGFPSGGPWGFSQAAASLQANFPGASYLSPPPSELNAASLEGVDILILTAEYTPLTPDEGTALRVFAENGGSVILLAWNEGYTLAALSSMLEPFQMEHGGTAASDFPVVPFPNGSPLTSGPFAYVDSVVTINPPYLAAVGPHGSSLLEAPDGRGSVLAVIRPDRLKPGSGIVVVASAQCFTDRYREVTGAGERFLPGVFSRNEDLFLNMIDACLARKMASTEPVLYRAPAGDFSVIARQADGTFTRTYENGAIVHFNARGLETAVEDRYHNPTAYDYDDSDRLIQITDPVGLVTRLDYTGQRLSTITDPTGRLTTFAHSLDGNLTNVVFADGSTRSFGYAPSTVGVHLLTSETDALGHTSRHEFDGRGRLLRGILPDGSVHESTSVQQLGWIDPTTGVGTISNPARPLTPQAQVSTFADGEGRRTTYVTGRFGEATDILDPAALRTRIDTDENGDPVLIVPPSGHSISNVYDSRGHVIEAQDLLLQSVSRFTYETNFLQLSSTVDPLGQTDRIEYDSAGNAIRMITPEGRQATAGYDGRGLLTTLTNEIGTETRFDYDTKGNLLAIVASGKEAGERSTANTYTPQGYLASVTDPLGRVAEFRYDNVGRVTNQFLPGNREVQFTYDLKGQLTSLTPPGRPAHRFQYNALGLLTNYIAPDLGDGSNQTFYAYNRAQQLTRLTRPDGKEVSLGYDDAGRLQSITNSRGVSLLQYSPVTGQLISNTSPDSVTLSFNYFGEIVTNVTWSGVITGQVSSSLNKHYQVTSMRVNDRPSIEYTYDADGLVTNVGALSIVRDPRTGVVTNTALGVVSTTTRYNSFGELTEYTAAARGTNLLMIHYDRDTLGRITNKIETLEGVTSTHAYSYDAAGRLSEVKENGATTGKWTYDSNGNRLSQTLFTAATSTTTEYTYDAQNRLLSAETSGSHTIFSYTEAGELRSKTEDGQTTFYSYDEFGNLNRVALPDGTEIEYMVDGQNRRVAKKVNGALIQSLLYSSQLQIVAELDGSGQVESEFLYASGRNVPDYMIKNGQTYRLVTDYLGSVRFVINAETGDIAQSLAYNEFGTLTLNSHPDFQPFAFCGGLYDTRSTLVRFGVRDYDAGTGRWTVQDPIRFQAADVNAYLYTGGDPINLIDPAGLNPEVWSARGSRLGRRPDYLSVTVGGYFGIGGQVTLTLDRFGHTYVTPAVGYGTPGLVASQVAGFIENPANDGLGSFLFSTPYSQYAEANNEANTCSFLKGESNQLSGSVFANYGLARSGNRFSSEFGISTPGITATKGYGIEVPWQLAGGAYLALNPVTMPYSAALIGSWLYQKLLR